VTSTAQLASLIIPKTTVTAEKLEGKVNKLNEKKQQLLTKKMKSEILFEEGIAIVESMPTVGEGRERALSGAKAKYQAALAQNPTHRGAAKNLQSILEQQLKKIDH
jgi:hypothetical protein